jgi:serine protease Do
MTRAGIGFFLIVATASAAGGLVIAGRMGQTSPSVAEPVAQIVPTAQTKPAAIAPSGAALPDLSVVAERAIQATANISSTEYQQPDPFFLFVYGQGAVREQTSLGSGVIVSADGYILTNSHVVGKATDVKVTLPDGQELKAKLVGTDDTTDLAVVKVEAKNLATLPWADSSKVRVAEWVLAVGSPFEFSQTVTLGIVSNIKVKQEQLGSFTDMIQTDAAINPGNSGGPLVNSRGEVVGVNTMIVSKTGGYQGLGFAIPSNMAQIVMAELIKNHEVLHGSIGVYDWRDVDPAAAQRAGFGPIHGVFVANMMPGSSGARAGIQRRDIILSFDGKEITSGAQLDRMIRLATVGSTVKMEVLRGTQHLTLNVAVEKR